MSPEDHICCSIGTTLPEVSLFATATITVTLGNNWHAECNFRDVGVTKVEE